MNILIVDDQRSARLVLKRMLRRLDGIEVFEAATLDDAKAQVVQVPLDLLLVDVRLHEGRPDQGGLDFLAWLRETGRSTPAVMVTASSELAAIRSKTHP